jgi:hypothetical protein
MSGVGNGERLPCAGPKSKLPSMEAETAVPVAERIPAAPELVERTEALVRDFPGCFWFRHPEAAIRYLDDVRLVVHHLREYGGWNAWRAAQDLQRCLLPPSSARS